MAATNGYRPEQASDLYISSGTTRDYQYGIYRIFAYTFEMSVKDYPDDSMIARRDRAEQGGGAVPDGACRVSVGRAGGRGAHRPLRRLRRRSRGRPRLDRQPRWHRHAPATARFVRANPASTTSAGPKQLGTVRSGSKAYVTGAAAGASASSQRPRRADVDPFAGRSICRPRRASA